MDGRSYHRPGPSLVTPNSEYDHFNVEYVGGYAEPGITTTEIELPRDLEQATLEIAKSWYLSRKRDNSIVEKKVGDLWIKTAGVKCPVRGRG